MSFDWDLLDPRCSYIDLTDLPRDLSGDELDCNEIPSSLMPPVSVTPAVAASRMSEVNSSSSECLTRLAAKSVFLTWSQAPEAMSKELVAGHLRTLGPVERMVVCEEHHSDGNKHYHAFVSYKKKLDFRNGPLAFRVNGLSASVKVPNSNAPGGILQSCQNMWNYCLKEDKSPLIQGDPPPLTKKRNRNESFSTAMELAVSSGIRAALDHLAEREPYELVTKRDAIERGLVAHRASHVQVERLARPLSDFHLPLGFNTSFNTLWLSGSSGYGKTQLARALLPKATVVSHVDQLRNCDFSQGLIFDDFSVRKWPPESVIHLVDWEVGRGVHCRYATAFIPAETKKIFTTNLDWDHWLPETADSIQQGAISRRVYKVVIDKRLF